MRDFAGRVANLSPAHRALFALKQTQARLEALERSRSEPIAIVGQACRFPGASDPEQYWRLLADGVCSITEVPSTRWDLTAYYDPDPDAPGKMYTRRGGFLDHVDRFDAEFFGITPREAVSMDPQQRLLLETSWRAIEDAGLTLTRLNSSATGVFIGISTCDYRQLDYRWRDPSRIDPYLGTGSVFSVAAGRLSYHLGLQGPNLAVDTACSSSLTCLHLGCASLRAGECNAALVGAVNLILWPEGTVYFCKLRALAADGRCKTFDASADGYVRGEGCSVIVLKRLSDAIADRDRVLAIVRGSAVNHDGPSVGLTAPNGAAQEAVIRAAIRNARCTPEDIQFVEAHGTGTALGDPIEVRALAAALGQRSDRCWLGSVKANVGHLEAAAGLAGLLKVVLAFQHERIPQQIHLQQPTPHVPWDDVPVRLPLSGVDWPRSERPRIAGLSSFGLSGTNAHIILEEAPRSAPSAKAERPIHILALSAKDSSALETISDSIRAKLSEPNLPAWADFCFSTNTGRSTFAHRLAVVAEDGAEAKDCLEGSSAKRTNRSGVVRETPKIAFLFSGQGSQYAGMGRELFKSLPVFRDELLRCNKILEPLLGRSIVSAMHAPSGDSLLTQTELCQPALFAIEYALTKLWASWGVTPDAVLGHSLGEYVAACIAGCFSLEDGLRLIARRGQLVQSLPADDGAMTAALCNEATLRDVIEAERLPLDIASVNSASNTVLSGHRMAVRQAISALQRRGIEARPLPVSHAFHSRLLDSILPQFEEFAGSVTSQAPRIALVSNVTCDLLDCAPDARYWRDHLRQPVRFRQGVQTLVSQGCNVFLEVGPGSVLSSLARQTVPEGTCLVSSLRPGTGEWTQMLTAVQELFARGANIDFSALDAPFERRRVSVPGHPFRPERFWLDEGSLHQPDTTQANPSEHPLLGRPVRTALEDKVFETELNAHSLPFVRDHQLFEEMLLPAAGFIEWACACACAAGSAFPLELSAVSFTSKLQLAPGKSRVAQICISPEKHFRILSLSETNDWILHARGDVIAAASHTELAPRDFVERGNSVHLTADAFYERLRRDGVVYGASLRGVQQVWQQGNEAFAWIETPRAASADEHHYYLHPALLDSCFQLLTVTGVEAFCEPGELFVPVHCQRFWFSGKTVTRVGCHAKLDIPNDSRAEFLSANLQLLDDDGSLVADVAGLQMKRMTRMPNAIASSPADPVPDWLVQLEWRRQPAVASLPSLTSTLQSLSELVEIQESDAALHLPPEFRRDLDALCGTYTRQALGSLEKPTVIDRRISVAPERRRLLSRLQEIAREDDGRPLPPTDAAGQLASLLRRFPEWRGELELLERCGNRVADVLRGECDPLQLLFPAGSIELTEAIYEHSPVTRFGNAAVVSVLRQAATDTEAGPRLRILEVGAGSGGTTASILEHLPADSFEYWFTDVSPLFLDRARRKFAKHRNIHFQIFDIEKSPSSQGFAPESFDVVLAANVIHATADLRQTCAHLREVLVADGRLLLLEGTGKQRWADLVFGLTDGWWRFSDTGLREEYPLLSASAWESFLSSQGFYDVKAVAPPRQSAAAAVEQAVILGSKRAGRFEGQRWLVLADASGIGAEIARRLDACGANCTVVKAGREFKRLPDGTWIVEPASVADFSRLRLEALAQVEWWHGAVHLWGLDPEDDLTNPVLGCASVLHLVQMLVNQQALGEEKLRIITRGAQALGDDSDDSQEDALSQSLVWGLAKAIAIEHPELECIRIDLGPSLQQEDVHNVWYELCHHDEDQVAWRRGQRHVARLTRWPTEEQTTLALPAEPSRLELVSRGVLESLNWKPMPVARPGPREVRIRVTATGLNFRDVLNALGAYSGNAGALGGECAGVIESVGEEVTQWKCGERVVALADAAFANFAVASSELVARLPDGLTDAEGAALPAAYLTVALGLGQSAQLRRGDRVLIHAATGGVGLAAIKWAQQAGAEIFATAGSRAKRAILRRLGVRHIFDSRSLNFAAEILDVTNHHGVDVVLNSLSGDFIEAGVQALAADGRFIEIGRKDIWSEERFHELRPRGRYYIVSLDQMAKDQPESVGRELRRITEAIADGRLAALPVTTFAPSEAVAAFRRMAQAKHVGKIVIRYDAGGSPAVRRDATYLITGGLGGLGLLTAGWLAESGARHLLLVGRSAPSAEAAMRIAALESRGVHVYVRRADISRAEEVAALWRDAGRNYPAIRGVLHLAGALDNGVLLQQNWSRFSNVLAAKVSGAWHLHNWTKNSDTDFFVLFSSVASLLGSPGQGNHAAANAFLDALAQHRRSRGLPGLSINWGAWSEIGAAAQYVASGDLRGLGSISPAEGLRALRIIWNSDRAQVGVVPVDWPAFVRQMPVRTPFLEEISHESSETPVRTPDSTASLAPAGSGLADAVRAQVAYVMGLAPGRLRDGRRPLHDLGLDSLMAVELRNRLSQLFGVSLPASLLYDYPTLDRLIDHLSDVVKVDSDSEPVTVAAVYDRRRSQIVATEPIAVIGMGCRFPAGATNPDRYWELLRRGGDGVIEVPSTRWDADALYDPDPSTPGKTNTRWGGFLDQVDTFDPAFFGISPREAVSMDPQQRLFLEVAWEALESAGIAPDRLHGTLTGVFLGMCGNDYARICAEQDGVDPYLSTGNAASVAAGRLSYLLGLQGPSVTLDTACSSSLVAVHLACQSLRLAECSLAVVGGVQLLLTPASTLALSRLGFMAPDGHCKTFDASANGFVRGEGCGVVVLRRLSEAQAAGDRVLAVIRGSAVNQDGRSGGLTAPNGPAQENLLRAALAAAGVQPADVGYVETHGTGTSLGDPIEVHALDRVMSDGRDEREPLRLGAVKANLGHLEAAAGIAGLIKTVLVLDREEIPPQIHFHTPSPHIDWQRSLFVSASGTKWPRGERPRIGGVSSFGFSGTNAHVVVEEAPAEPLSPERSERPWHVLTLSAHSEGAGEAMVDQYVRFLDEHRDIALPNVCYTANTGRAHGLYRLAVVAESSSDLRRVLQQAEIEFHYVEAPPRIAFEFPDVAKVDVPSVFELRQSQSAFRQALDRIADLIRRRVSDQPLKELLGGRWGGLMQGYALVELLRSWGIVASEATGEGWGRYLADCVVGKLSVEELVARASPETYRRERQAQRTVSITFGTAQPMSCTADWKHLTTLAAHSYESGVAIDWQAFDKDYVRRKETLPTYPFQRRRYWAGSDPVIEGSEWTYRIAWQPSSENRAPDRSGAWLVFCDEQTKSARLIQKLIRQGQLCHLVSQKSASSQSELRDLLASQPWSAVVCCFLSDLAQDDRATLAIDWTGSGAFVARIVEALLSHPGPRLWVITQGGTAVEDRDIPVLAHSPLWGLGRTISLEHPQWWGGLVDIDPADADFQDFEFPDLVNERLDQIAFRNGRRLTPQLQRLVASSQQRIQIRRDANYLITGGLGALGVYVAQWLAERGASQLTLLGRRGWDETPKLRRRVVEELRSQGVQVDVHTADVTDLARMESIFAELARGPLALRGIIHTAGRVQAQAVAALTVGDYRTIASAKVQGGWNLHRLSMPFDLDFFVLFSSAASVWGSQGSGAYSAGNHFLDTLAHYRRARGLPATTVNWARLSERGMLEADEARALQRMGVRQVPVRAGLDVMDYLVGGDLAQAVVANIDWNMFYNVYSARRERPMLEALARECSKKEQLSASPGEERAKLQNLPASQRVAFLATLIKEHLAFVLKLESAQSIGLHQGFFSLGMDSLMAVDLKERLQHMLNHPVSVSTVVTHSNTQALSEHLLAELFDGTAADVPLPELGPELGQTAGRVAGLLDLVEDLSEQEVEQSLRRKLAKSRS